MIPLLPLILWQAAAKAGPADFLRDDAIFEMRQAEESGQLPEGSKGDVYRGYLAARFDRPADASRFLKSYLADKGNSDLEAKAFAYELLIDADARLGRYKDSAAEAEQGLAAVGSYLNATRKQEMIDAGKRAKILADVAPQSSEVSPFEVTMKKDMAQLNRVPISVGETTIDAVFDTGAQLTVLTQSVADACGLKAFPETIPVDSVTGAKVQAHLAELPDLKFGASTFRHVIALVMADKDLTFGPYKISAIVGFPVIEALGRLEFGRAGQLRAGYRSDKPSLRNLALKGLGPVVQGHFRNVDLTFNIDTGAMNSHFTKNLIDRFPDIAKGERGVLNLGGAGGAKPFKTYILPNFEMNLGGQTVRLPKADVLTESSNEAIDRFYGNLGQDVFRQFDTMVIDFRNMSFEFVNS